MIKVYGVVRVSSAGQDDDSIPIQRELIKGYVKQNRDRHFAGWLDNGSDQDAVESSTCTSVLEVQMRMPNLWRFISKCHSEPVELVFKNHTRFGRMDEDTIVRLWPMLKDNNIQLVNLGRPSIPGNTVMNIIMMLLDANSANSAGKTISADTKLGHAKHAEQKFRNGGSAPLGYVRMVVDRQGNPYIQNGKPLLLRTGQTFKDRNNDKEWNVRFTIDPKPAELVREIFRMYCEEGKGTKVIAGWLKKHGHKTVRGNDFTHTAVSAMLQNPIYRGTMIYGMFNRRPFKRKKGMQLSPEQKAALANVPRMHDESKWITVEDCHDALCEPDQWTYIEQRLNGKSAMKGARRKSGDFVLNGGMMKCTCGGNLVAWSGGSKKAGNIPRYVCTNFMHGWHKQGEPKCPPWYIHARKLEEAVFDRLRLLVSDKRIIKRAQQIEKQWASREAELKAELKQLSRELDCMAESFRRTGSERLEKKFKELEAREKQLKEQIEAEREACSNSAELIDAFEKMRDEVLTLSHSDKELQRTMIRRLLPGPIICDPHRQEIHLGQSSGQSFYHKWYPVRDSNP